MRKSKNNDIENDDSIKKKLDAIIEHSKLENGALRKILLGLEKKENTQSAKNKNSKK
jgi:hypothetical protein